MADPQDRPDHTPEPAPPPPTEAAPPPPPAEPAAPPVAHDPDKPAKKAPAKKAAAKKAAPAKKAAKKAAAKKTPAKKAPAKTGPAKKAAAKKIAPPPETNGQLAAAAKDAAAHAKATVEAAHNPLPAQESVASGGRSPVPFAVAIAVSLLAILLIRQLRHDDD